MDATVPPDFAELAQIGDPLQRAKRAGEIGASLRRWPRQLVAIRRAAVAELVADNRLKRVWLANELKISGPRLSQIAKAAATQGAAA